MVLLSILDLYKPSDVDLAGDIRSWIDKSHALAFSSSACQADLDRLADLRLSVYEALEDQRASLRQRLMDYAAALDSCIEDGGFPPSAVCLSTTWRQSGVVAVNCRTIEGERAMVVVNLALLEAKQAMKQPLTTQVAWKAAAGHLASAAAIVDDLRHRLVKHDVDDGPFDQLESLTNFFMGDAQRAAYETFRCLPRPKHLMLTRLAAACLPHYQTAEECVDAPWADGLRASNMYMTALAEYHQAMVHGEKREFGLELARLEAALRFGSLCRDYCADAEPHIREALPVDVLLTDMETNFSDAEAANVELNQTVPDYEELPEIRPQATVKLNPSAASIILKQLDPPLFTSITVMDEDARRLREEWQAQVERLVSQTARAAADQTERARQTLSTVNLPHSLTAVRQAQSGGGLPEDLWLRIREIQQDGRDVRLTQEMWELRDYAEAARELYRKIDAQLEEDRQMDELFRQEHPNFEGHDVDEVQRSFRQALANYDRLMIAAQESDDLLLERCEILETDPKFRLLKFHKSQLDHLLPRSSIDVDTDQLSQYLVDLSSLIDERERLVDALEHWATSLGASLSSTAEWDAARASFGRQASAVESTFARQKALLHCILSENETFMRERDRGRSTAVAGDSCIVKIEDALEEIDQFSKHLKEGRAFYDVILPKLQKLKQQVGDVSARLTVERCEYEDKASRSRQEAQDARMAADLASPTDSAPAAAAAPTPAPIPPPPDDSIDPVKAATLISMDFSPEKVYAALKKYDNNVDQALNDLLSG